MRLRGLLLFSLLGFTTAMASLQAATRPVPTPSGHTVPMQPEVRGISLIWLGHACVQIIPTTGPTVVIDPFKAPFGTYPVPNVMAKVVLITHSHFDHNAPEEIAGNPVVFRGPGIHRAAGVIFKGIAAFHDDQGGKQRGPDTLFAFTLDKVRFCHLGDLGQHALTPQQLQQIGKVDVLFIPVGGFFTIDAKQAAGIVAQIKPKIVIPIHYKTPLSPPDLPIVSADAFLRGKRNMQRLPENTVLLSWANLPKTQMILVFQPPKP